MPEAKVYNMEGKETGSIALASGVFDVEINMNCVRETLNQYLIRQRRGTASTKTRGEVSGGGAKPWRQKGTGRARAGSNRSPIWRGGAIVFGPIPHDYDCKVNKQKRQKAFTSALTSFARENRVFVLDDFEFAKPQTKAAVSLLKNMGTEGNALIVTAKPESNFFLSCRNLPNVSVITIENINIYDLLNHDNFMITRSALKQLEEMLS